METATETISSAKEMCKLYWERDIPTYMHGPSGVGKSAVFKQLSEEEGCGFIDIRLGTKLPEDLSGIPVPDLEQQMAVWLKAEFWPDLKRDWKRGIILFDELSDAPRSLQSCAYQVILDRRIGKFELPPGWWPCAAGNRREDQAAAGAISTALANRFAHIHVAPDVDSWVEWALQNGIDPLIIGFLRFRKNLIYNLKDSNHLSFPSPR